MSTQGSVHPDRAEARALPREQGRLRLRLLDACLEQLERAHERGAVTVPAPVALAVGKHVPAISPGMPITYALQLVMREQEPHLAYGAAAVTIGRPIRQLTELTGRPTAPTDLTHNSADRAVPRGRAAVQRDGSSTPADASVPDIDLLDARDLTDRIKAAAQTVGKLGTLLVEAHERRAWCALRYATWSDYVRAEFHLSRSRSYELLDHGRVLRAVEAVVGLSGIPDISPYAAAQIKPYLAEVTEMIRVRSAGLVPEDAAQVALQIVREVRSRLSEERRALERFEVLSTDASADHVDITTEPSPRRAGVESGSVDLMHFYAAVDALATMPPVTETVLLVLDDHSHDLANLAAALGWLAEFTQAWKTQDTRASGQLEHKPQAC